MPTPRFSVVIATYNRASELRETLRSLGHLEATGGWELLVVDNNSTDDTALVVEEYARSATHPVRYLHETMQGRSAALNAGIRAACSRFGASYTTIGRSRSANSKPTVL